VATSAAVLRMRRFSIAHPTPAKFDTRSSVRGGTAASGSTRTASLDTDKSTQTFARLKKARPSDAATRMEEGKKYRSREPQSSAVHQALIQFSPAAGECRPAGRRDDLLHDDPKSRLA